MTESLQNKRTTEKKLREAKKTGIKMFALDYDGNLAGGGVSHEQAANIICEIVRRRIFPTIISARGVTLLHTLLPFLREKERSSLIEDIPIVLSGSNGAYMVVLRNSVCEAVYSNQITLDKCAEIANYYKRINKGYILRAKGLAIFDSFLNHSFWQNEWYISSDYLDLARKYDNIFFCEPTKATIVLPEDIKDAEVVRYQMKERFQGQLHVEGDADYLHFSAVLEHNGQRIDSKVYAALKAMSLFRLSDVKKVVAMGDQPEKNDSGLLGYFPYSFTNNVNYRSKQGSGPYLLSDNIDKNPVSATYRAISFLLK